MSRAFQDVGGGICEANNGDRDDVLGAAEDAGAMSVVQS